MERVAILVTLLIIGRKSLENTGERGGVRLWYERRSIERGSG
jgi:hypothetical protein